MTYVLLPLGLPPVDVYKRQAQHFEVFLHRVTLRLQDALLQLRRLRYLAELVVRHDDAIVVVDVYKRQAYCPLPYAVHGNARYLYRSIPVLFHPIEKILSFEYWFMIIEQLYDILRNQRMHLSIQFINNKRGSSI